MGLKEGFCDLLVIGGGPAGTTLAALVKKYAPSRRVVLLEKESGPCHQVGESLLPGIVPVLKELGVYEAIDSAGFARKLGATYIWGPDRRPWENDFNEINIQDMIERHGQVPEKIEYAWQVRRSVYDEILLRHAESAGVEVLRGVMARDILEEGGRVCGARFTEASGKSRSLRAEFTADCSGQSGFLSKFRSIREYNPALKNVAMFAYFKGAKWKYNYTGHPDKTKIFVCSIASGWFWYIPIAKDLVSVGLVTMVDYVKKRGIKDLRRHFFNELRACAEIWPLLAEAEHVKDVEGTGRDFFTHRDWSYLNVAASGPGWLAAGDAAVFVDPILSTGVTLAHHCAHRASYTLLSQWAQPQPAMSELLWKDYDLFCRESAAQYLVLAMFWYGNDPCARNWWVKARDLQRALLPVDLGDKRAFVTVSAGLTQHYDRMFTASSLAQEHLTKPDEYPFYMAVLQGADGGPPDPEAPADGDVPRFLCEFLTELVFVPAHGEGLLKPVKRVRFLKESGGDPVSDAINPRKVVTRYHLELMAAIDGRRTLAQARAAAAAKGAPAWWLNGPARVFLKELRLQGVLAFGVEAAL